MSALRWRQSHHVPGRRALAEFRTRRTLAAIGAVVAVAASATACGGNGNAGTSSGQTQAAMASLIQPPKLTLQGCEYEVNNTIPAGEPKGSKAPFAPFAPDPSAVTALRHIKEHGGTGVVDGFTLPGGTVLFTGPDVNAAKAGVIPQGSSVLMTDPILWTDSSGGDWLASFVICGGRNLYWLSVDQLLGQNRNLGQTISETLTQLRSAPPFTKTGMISLLPVTVDDQDRFAWVGATLQFEPARAQYLAP
jgi:hypothetical protein